MFCKHLRRILAHLCFWSRDLLSKLILSVLIFSALWVCPTLSWHRNLLIVWWVGNDSCFSCWKQARIVQNSLLSISFNNLIIICLRGIFLTVLWVSCICFKIWEFSGIILKCAFYTFLNVFSFSIPWGDWFIYCVVSHNLSRFSSLF